MGSFREFVSGPSAGPAGVVLIRIAAGLAFFTQGILKFADPTAQRERRYPSIPSIFTGTASNFPAWRANQPQVY